MVEADNVKERRGIKLHCIRCGESVARGGS